MGALFTVRFGKVLESAIERVLTELIKTEDP